MEATRDEPPQHSAGLPKGSDSTLGLRKLSGFRLGPQLPMQSEIPARTASNGSSDEDSTPVSRLSSFRRAIEKRSFHLTFERDSSKTSDSYQEVLGSHGSVMSGQAPSTGAVLRSASAWLGSAGWIGFLAMMNGEGVCSTRRSVGVRR